MKIPGYITPAQALAEGYTHHGKYFGVPIWIGNPDHEGCSVAAKWVPMEAALTVVTYIEGFMQALFFPDREPAFQLLVGKRIVL